QVASCLGILTVTSDARMARARERVGLVWQGDAVPARHRAAQSLLPHPGARRPAGHSRARGGQAADARPFAGTPPDAALGVARCPRRRQGVGDPRSPATPTADPRGGQALAPPGEPGPALAADLRGPPLERLRDPGGVRWYHGQ